MIYRWLPTELLRTSWWRPRTSTRSISTGYRILNLWPSLRKVKEYWYRKDRKCPDKSYFKNNLSRTFFYYPWKLFFDILSYRPIFSRLNEISRNAGNACAVNGEYEASDEYAEGYDYGTACDDGIFCKDISVYLYRGCISWSLKYRSSALFSWLF